MLRDLLAPQAEKASVLSRGDARSQGVAVADSQLFGTAFALHIIRVPALVAMTHEQMVTLVAPRSSTT